MVPWEEAELAGGLLVSPAPVPPASSLGPPGALAREESGVSLQPWGRRLGTCSSFKSPHSETGAPSMAARVQTREASINRLK